ncbi:MAG: PHP domain-containing protein [Vicinamibacteria bacterium]
MHGRRRKLFLAVFAIAFGSLLLRGLALYRYEPKTSDAYLWGAFHVHSTFSDGLSPIEEIARAAREARVDFVMLSDHGPPHAEATTLEKTLEGVRFIGGSEVALPDGHLIVSDIDELPLYTLPPYPPEAVADVARWGGMSIVTYPEDPVYGWGYWNEGFVPDGIEILNVTSYFRAGSPWRKLSWALFSLFNPRYYISGFEAPTFALEKWDRLLERGEVHGFYANNAHGGFPLTEKRTIAVPSYRTALGYVGLGVDRRHREAPEEAIRRGEFFSLVRAAGEPERFEFLEKGGSLDVRLEGAPPGARIDVKRNGEVMASTKSGELRFETSEAGAYRAEVYLEHHPLLGSDVPWILSNAIFLGPRPSPAPEKAFPCGEVDPLPLSELRLEKDDESSGAIELSASGGLKLSYHLSQQTPERVDRWVALSYRKEMDLSSYRGVHIEGSSPSTMRYWIEVRAGDEGHYASVELSPGGASVDVPWERFYPTLGEKRAIPLRAIDALFITVNTSSSRTGFSTELSLDAIGFCR